MIFSFDTIFFDCSTAKFDSKPKEKYPKLREIEELKMPCSKREHIFSGHSREFPGSSPRARAHAFQSTK